MDDNKLELLLKAFAIALGVKLVDCPQGDIKCLERLIQNKLNEQASQAFSDYLAHNSNNIVDMER